MHKYKELRVWEKSRTFCSEIYSITSTLPSDERYGLASQIRRASISMVSNIAEGASRTSRKEFKRYLEIAIGSAYEIETHLLISSDLKFIEASSHNKLMESLDLIIKMLSKLRSKI